MKLGQRLVFFIAVVGLCCLGITPLLAQSGGGAVSLRYAVISPFIALLAGILILIIPRLLNYIVAIYLILVGLVGIFGR